MCKDLSGAGWLAFDDIVGIVQKDTEGRFQLFCDKGRTWVRAAPRDRAPGCPRRRSVHLLVGDAQ